MIFAVVRDVSGPSGPIIGDDVRAMSSERNREVMRSTNEPYVGRACALTTRVHMSLNLLNEVPHFCAPLWILETESIVDAVGLCPNDQGLCGGAYPRSVPHAQHAYMDA